MESITNSESCFSLSMRCWVYPFCYFPPEIEKCKRIEASGLSCKSCPYRNIDEEKASEIQKLYKQNMPKKAKLHYDFLKTSGWKNARSKILQHDKKTCIICGKTEGKFHIHHVLDFSGSENLTPENLVCLCNECHIKLHPVFPMGLLNLGWPNLTKFEIQLTSFYEKVQQASIKNQDRLVAPLEHIMFHLCYICEFSDKCNYGKFTKKQIEMKMVHMLNAKQKKAKKKANQHVTKIKKTSLDNFF